MKIIQSFWSCNDVKRNFGWFSEKHHLLGWILSSCQLREFYDDVTIYTDDAGYELLINKLKLPYTNAVNGIELLNEKGMNKDLWAYSKILAYSNMSDPFLHIDGDVFIWESFEDKLLKNDLIVQNPEITTDYYGKMWSLIKPHLTYIPNEMMLYDKGITNKAFNMGIFGGNDIEFIKKYSEHAMQFVERNKNKLPGNQQFNFNIFFEQVLLYNMVYPTNKIVGSLIKEDIGDNEYKNFGNFDEVPFERTYLHLLGFFKRQFTVCNKLDIYVQKYLPHYYCHLEEYLNITQKLYHFGHTYKLEDHQKFTSKYLEAIKSSKPIANNKEAIFSRNILCEGQLRTFEYLLKKDKPFIFFRLSHFQIDYKSEQILIETLDDLIIELPILHIDTVIFDIIQDNINKQNFEELAKTYLEDDFPENEKENFIHLLYQRISIFISLGIIYIQEIEKSIKNFHERSRNEWMPVIKKNTL